MGCLAAPASGAVGRLGEVGFQDVPIVSAGQADRLSGKWIRRMEATADTAISSLAGPTSGTHVRFCCGAAEVDAPDDAASSAAALWLPIAAVAQGAVRGVGIDGRGLTATAACPEAGLVAFAAERRAVVGSSGHPPLFTTPTAQLMFRARPQDSQSGWPVRRGC